MFPLGHVGLALLLVAPVVLLLDRKRRYPPVAVLALALTFVFVRARGHPTPVRTGRSGDSNQSR